MSIGADAEFIDLSIHIPNNEPMTKYDKSVWIRGIWHFINITLDGEADKVSIVLYHGNTPPVVDGRNETNYYEWEYDSDIWRDVQHSSYYIDEDYCLHSNDFFSFYIGVDQSAKLGNWTMKIFADEELLSSNQVFIEHVVTSFGLKTVPVSIKAEPFTEEEYVSEEKFTVENDGNIPLRLSIDYGKYKDIFSTLDFNNILRPGQTARYSILMYSDSTLWKPGTLTIKSEEISVNAAVDNVIPPKKIASLIERNTSIGLPINIYVGHIDAGYELNYLTDDITFDYVTNLDIFFGEAKAVYAYISGNGEVTVDVTGQNLEILSIFSGDVEVGSRFTINSTDTSEYPIVVYVKGIRPNSTAYLYYELETGGERQVFTTTINVGPSRPIEVFDAMLLIELGLMLSIILAVIYMTYTHIKHRKK